MILNIHLAILQQLKKIFMKVAGKGIIAADPFVAQTKLITTKSQDIDQRLKGLEEIYRKEQAVSVA